VQISVEVVRNPHQLRGTETALTVNCPRQRVGRHPDSSSHTPLLAPRNQTCYTVANRVVHLVDRTGILGKSQYRALRRLHQLGAGDSKHLTWPHYVIALYRRLACPVHLLVLCPTTTVARWAATPIDFGAGTLTPTVIGPDTIPAIAEPDTARELPDLMMLSAMVHHHNRAVLRALTRIFAADIPDHELYDVLSRLILPKSAREYLEELMTTINFPWADDTEYAQEQRARGEARGKAEGKAEALLTVLESRSLTITDTDRARILGCDDGQQIQNWLTRAASVPTVEDLLT
jgi:hypothetical protein